jgi:hypothetical protein
MNLVKPIRLSAILSVACIALFAVGAFGQGRYANVYSRTQVEGFISQLEQSSNAFRTDFVNQVDRSNLNSSTKRQYKRDAEQFENSLDVLKRRFDSSNSWWESRNDVQTMISNSQNLNTTMNSAAFRRNLERQWNRLRNDINKLADTYDLPGLNGGGWNGGPGFPGPGGPGFPGGGGPTDNPPSWAQGTFQSVNSRDNIQLTLDRNGRVTVVNNGQTYYGRFYRNQIYVNGDVSDITRNGNGVRTYNRSNGDTTVYTRGGFGGGGGGNIGRPPSWAVGTFYSTTGTNIRLTINSNGRVTVINAGQSYPGTFYNNTITVNGDTSTLTQTRRGLSTYNQYTGQTTEYRRQ